MKIGIMGGTFDPVHNGHLMLGHAAYEAFSLDQIWFMPNGNPPHKKSETIKSTAEDRMKMTSLAIAPFPEFVLQPYEALRAEVSCSYQTMEHFSKIYPDDEFYFIIGADSLMAIETWVHPERIFPTCTILATYRNEVKTKEEIKDDNKTESLFKRSCYEFRSNLPDWKEQHDTGSYQSYPGGTGRKRTDQSQCT